MARAPHRVSTSRAPLTAPPHRASPHSHRTSTSSEPSLSPHVAGARPHAHRMSAARSASVSHLDTARCLTRHTSMQRALRSAIRTPHFGAALPRAHRTGHGVTARATHAGRVARSSASRVAWSRSTARACIDLSLNTLLGRGSLDCPSTPPAPSRSRRRRRHYRAPRPPTATSSHRGRHREPRAVEVAADEGDAALDPAAQVMSLPSATPDRDPPPRGVSCGAPLDRARGPWLPRSVDHLGSSAGQPTARRSGCRRLGVCGHRRATLRRAR